jgi:hypothetical protein
MVRVILILLIAVSIFQAVLRASSHSAFIFSSLFFDSFSALPLSF